MTTTAAHADIQPRIVRTLMGAQVLGGVGMAAGIAVGALLAEDISGKESLAGLGTTFQVLGGALLAIPTARIMARRGRGTGLQVALGLALLGTVLIVISAVVRSFLLLLLGMMLFGGGTTANSQSRYAAADLSPPERRGRDLSMVVWATTIGSVVGPNLVGPGKALAGILHLPQLVGTFVFSIAGFAAAMLVIRTFLHPDPLLTARASAAASVPADVVGVGTVPVTGAKRDEDGSIGRGLQVVRSNATAAIAIAIVALGHFVMVSVMVMTPIHMKHGHAELEVIGFVISMHIAGMFALSPLVGWAVDRLGAPAVAGFGGFVLIGASVLSALSASGWSVLLLIALTVLGFGWSCAFISGSTMLTHAISPAERPATQGLADLVMGLCGAGGGAVAGVIVDRMGYNQLGWVSAVIALFIVVLAVTGLRSRKA